MDPTHVGVSPMRFSLSPHFALSTCITLCVGCHIWQTEDPHSEVSAVVAKSVGNGEIVRDEAYETLTAQLAKDLWKPARAWTPRVLDHLPETSQDREKTFRWEFGSAPIPQLTKEAELIAETEERSPLSEESNEADGGSAVNVPPSSTPTDSPPPPPESTGKSVAQSSADVAEANPSDQQLREAEPEKRGSKWDGFWPLRTAEILKQLDGDSDAPPSQPRDEPTNVSSRSERLLELLSQRDELVGWNAAILWARRNPAGSQRVVGVLERLIVDPPDYELMPPDIEQELPIENSGSQTSHKPGTSNRPRVPISPAMRNAAAEAWCLQLAAMSPKPIDGLAAAGRLLEKSNIPVALRGELFRSVAAWAAPARIPRLENALRTGSGNERAPIEIRRAAIEACLIHAYRHRQHVRSTPTAGGTLQQNDETAWPSTVDNCRYDPDDSVRRAFGEWVAITKHPSAFEILKSQATDVGVRVREAALVNLGLLGTPEAHEALLRHAKSPMERVRANAVTGLSEWGAVEIAPFAEDSSHHVKQIVAEGLGRHPCVEAAVAMQLLLIDRDLVVQKAAVKALESWPDDLAGPLLLQAMRDGAQSVRQMAFNRLQARFGEEQPFPFGASHEVRSSAVLQLAERHKIAVSFLDQLHNAKLKTVTSPDYHRREEIRSALARLTQHPPASESYAEAMRFLSALGVDDVRTIEEYLSEFPASHAGPASYELLPRLSPVYRALADLKSAEINTRRRAAEQLAAEGSKVSLSRRAVQSLRDTLVNEQDNLVWRYAMTAILNDATEESAAIAQLAINHTWPDIRERGCEYVARHGNPRHAVWILPLLHDENRNVRLAAVRAAGQCHNPIVIDSRTIGEKRARPRGLRYLLTDPDRQIRFAVAVSLSRLGDEQGMHEMNRLVSDLNANIREAAVKEMGRTGQTRFVDRLIQLAWTESNDRVKRAILESLIELVPPEKRPPGLYAPSNDDDKIRVWNAWWQQQRREAVSSAVNPQ
jgi:HEAT repeat protein